MNELKDGCYAVIPGTGILGELATYVVYSENDFEWYLQAAEIIIKFCEYAMTLEDPVMEWSG